MTPSYCISCRFANQLEKDLAVSLTVDLGMQGCEEEDEPGAVLLKIYFSREDQAEKAAVLLKERFPGSQPAVAQVPWQDWNLKWKQNMQPASLAEGVWASPAWRPPDAEQGDIWIKIEPRMAFGTGHHESTRLAARGLLFLKQEIRGRRFLDAGAGSGILCFLADRLGSSLAIGVDRDMDCLENLQENALANPPQSKVSFVMGPLQCIKSLPAFHVLSINMIRARSFPLLELCSTLVEPGGYGVWSGLLCDERDAAVTCARDSGWRMVKELTLNNWWGGVMKRV